MRKYPSCFMKNQILLAPVLLATGIAIGWFARDSSSQSPKANTTAQPASAPQTEAVTTQKTDESITQRGKSIQRETSSEEKSKTVAEALSGSVEEKESDERVGKIMETMAKRQRASLDQHATRLDASLSLRPDQKEKLAAWMDDCTKDAAGMHSAALNDDPSAMIDAQSRFTPQGLEKFLEGLLTDEQKTGLEQFRERDQQSKADTLALKNLSQIQKAVDFQGGQRDQVYQILSEDARQRLSQTSKTDEMAGFMQESMGIEMDPYDLGVNTLMQDVMGISGENFDMESMKDGKRLAQNLREELNKRIDRKVELLRPALDERQLQQYRTELQTRGGGFVDQMIMGIEMMQDHDTFSIENKTK